MLTDQEKKVLFKLWDARGVDVYNLNQVSRFIGKESWGLEDFLPYIVEYYGGEKNYFKLISEVIENPGIVETPYAKLIYKVTNYAIEPIRTSSILISYDLELDSVLIYPNSTVKMADGTVVTIGDLNTNKMDEVVEKYYPNLEFGDFEFEEKVSMFQSELDDLSENSPEAIQDDIMERIGKKYPITVQYPDVYVGKYDYQDGMTESMNRIKKLISFSDY